jgi:hypothetical protein
MKKLILIVGLQKSGTTLLTYLLRNAYNVKLMSKHLEGGLWRNYYTNPPFTPQNGIEGEIYHRYAGERGHEFSVTDATPERIQWIKKKIQEDITYYAVEGNHIGIMKDPYNTVRIPFIRKVLPGAFILGIVRRGVSNVFSLYKKYHPASISHSRPPAEGWWGVKPSGWRHLINDDKIVQIACQWARVNIKMAADRPDLMVWYSDLCAYPQKIIGKILQQATGEEQTDIPTISRLRCCDDEVTERGSRLQSKCGFKDKKEKVNLVLPEDDLIELQTFNASQIDKIRLVTEETEQCLLKLYPPDIVC